MDVLGWTIVVGAALSTWGALFPLGSWLRRWQMLDVPTPRSLHADPTPRGGGVMIVFSVLLSSWIYVWLNDRDAWQPVAVYSGAALLIAVVSWWDDLRSLSALLRFAAHCLGAIVAVWGLGYIDTLLIPGTGALWLGWVGLPLTLLWIVGLTNAYNFMDGIDGLAAAQGVIAGVGWALFAWLADVPALTLLGLVLAAGCAGFLWHNWSPARIFLGDVGSAFLGYTFAVLPLLCASFGTDPEFGRRGFVCGLVTLWPFVFDASFTILRRLRHGENIFVAHRTHLYQRLVLRGFGHRFVTLLYAALACIGLGLSLAWMAGLRGSDIALAATVPLLSLGLWGYVVYQERRQSAGAPAKPSASPAPKVVWTDPFTSGISPRSKTP